MSFMRPHLYLHTYVIISIFVSGDVFDEGEWSNEKQFKDYVELFYRLFAVPSDVSMHIVAGNHDIGFHN